MKKLLANVLVLLVVAAAVFLIGWIQFSIKPGQCGIMVSKTCGVLEKPVMPGVFAWRWEKLLPTNVTLQSYSMDPYKSVQKFSGTLSGGEIYAGVIDPKPDFSYEMEITVSLSIEPVQLVKLVKSHEVSDQESLNTFFDNKAKIISKIIADSILDGTDSFHVVAKAYDKASLARIVSRNEDDLSCIVLNAVEISKAKIPDLETYCKARELYDSYKNAVDAKLAEKAENYAYDVYEENKKIQTLEKYAQLLKQYPQLKDLQSIKEISSVLETVEPNPGLED